MKNIISILALITTLFMSAQNCNPVETNEYCPNENLTFTVSGLPANYSNINTAGGVQIIQNPVRNNTAGTSITFIVKFPDTAGNYPSITISWNGNGISGNKPFYFNKIHSLMGGYKEGNIPSTFVAPICQTTPITFTISGDKYWEYGSGSLIGYGSITNYKYIIPAGWYLGSTLSTGSNWISGTGNITITPDANTGNGNVIQYKAINDCSGAFFEGTPRYVSISRQVPTFTLTPSSLQFVCGTPQTKTFTVTSSSATTCPVVYSWNVGSGWLYNGNPAPSSFNTTVPSITLASANPNVLPSSVTVTPILNGISYSSVTCTTSFTPFNSTASFPGTGVICIGGNYTYNIFNLGTNNTVVWSLSNSQFATLSNASQNQVRVNAIANGAVNLVATITNQCGQVSVLQKPLFMGVPLLTNIGSSISFCQGGGQREQNKITVSTSSIVSAYQWHCGNNPGTKELSEISIISGYNTNQVYLDIPSTATNGSVYVRTKNTCGWSPWVYVGRPIYDCGGGGSGSDPGCLQCFKVAPTPKFIVSLNPSDQTVKVGLSNTVNKAENSTPTKIYCELFDMLGRSKTKFEIIDNQSSFQTSGLTKGIYILKINNNNEIETHKIVVE